MILKRARDDLRCRGRALIDQYDDWNAFDGIGARGIESQIRIGHTAGRVDDQSVLDEYVRDLDGGLQDAARVVTKVHNEAQQFAFCGQFVEGLHHFFAGAALELRNPNVPVTLFQRAVANARHLNHFTNDRHLLRLRDAFAQNRQLDFTAGLATHRLDRLAERHAFHRFVVELDDQVARLDAGSLGGRIVHGADDLDETVFHAHFQSQSAVVAGRVLL